MPHVSLDYPPPRPSFNNLTPGAPIAVAKHSPVLFTKFDRPSGEQKESLEDAKKKKKEKQLKNSKKAAKGGGKNNAKGGGSDPNQDLFTKINLRVGVIEDIQLHSSADKLYVETINIGEESGPRQIVSGLRLHYPDMASLKGRKVIVVANLKKANLVGVASNGMVLCAVNKGACTMLFDTFVVDGFTCFVCFDLVLTWF